MEHGKKAYGENSFQKQEAEDSTDLCVFLA